MKAVLVRKPYGEENTSLNDVDEPQRKDGEILVAVKYGVLNPIDITVIRNKTVYGLKPDPHIPGAEIAGTALTDGAGIRKGDRVLLYPRWFDGTCKYCKSGREYLCSNGGIFGVLSNGGYCEKISVPEKMLVKIPEALKIEDAVSLPVGGLTSYHALKIAGAKRGESLLVYGASGNTGVFAVLLGKRLGLDVIAVSSKDWVKEFGASRVYRMGDLPENLKADIVINSLGNQTWADSLNRLERGGRLVTFGVFTGATSELNIAKVYTQELQILGSTGGSISEFRELISMMAKEPVSLPTDKIYSIDDIKEAIRSYPERKNGRILLRVS